MKKLLLAGAMVLGMAGFAFAEFTPPALDIAPVEAMAGVVLAGLAVVWGLRKIIKFINRS